MERVHEIINRGDSPGAICVRSMIHLNTAVALGSRSRAVAYSTL